MNINLKYYDEYKQHWTFLLQSIKGIGHNKTNCKTYQTRLIWQYKSTVALKSQLTNSLLILIRILKHPVCTARARKLPAHLSAHAQRPYGSVQNAATVALDGFISLVQILIMAALFAKITMCLLEINGHCSV